MSRTLREYQDGETIFAQGDPSTHAFVLTEGTVELSQAADGAPVTLSYLKVGETFGDMSVIEGTPHQATARAIGAVVVELIPRDEFTGEITSNSFSALGLIRSLVGRLRDMNAKAVGAAPAARAAPSPAPRAGFFDFLRGGGNAATVRIATFPGGDAALSRLVAQRLSRRPGLNVKTLNITIDATELAREADENAPVELVDPTPEEKAARHAEAAANAARAAVLKAKADLLIWGEVAEPGATLTLYFTTATGEDEDKPGLFADVIALKLPATVTEDWSNLLYAVVLAAAAPADEATAAHLRQLLPRAVEAVRDFVVRLPYDVTTEERTAATMAFANATAQAAALVGSGHLFRQAAKFYNLALDATDKTAAPLVWALGQRNLGLAQHGVADAGGDEMDAEITPERALGAAVDAYRAASQVLSKSVLPLIWAAVQNRIGVALYKLDAKSQDAEILKHTLSAYQAALQVFSPQQSPLRWAEVMHNLAQAAQVLGGQLRNQELLQKAVDACRAALRVRRKETQPFLWASTQNNLGSALFLLGRTMEDSEALGHAAEAFAQVRDFYEQAGNANPAAIAGRNLGHVEKVLATLERRTQPNRPPRMKWEPPDDPVEPPAEPEPEAEPGPKPENPGGDSAA